MKNLYLFTGYKKNSELCLPCSTSSELCVPPSTSSERRCKHRPCGSFFALFLIFVLFLVSSCGGGSPSPAGNSTKVDNNGNGLIDIYTLTQLHNMRYDLLGESYKTTSDTAVTGDTSGCPGGVCRGYELRQDLTFDRDSSKDGTWSTSDNGYTLDPDDNAPPYFVVSKGGWQPIGSATIASSTARCNGNCFNSVFEGNGNTITGLATRSADIVHIGMFGATGTSARIRRVGLAANLASYTGNVPETAVGGLVGLQEDGYITASYTKGNVKNNGVYEGIKNRNVYLGGLVGLQNSGYIIASYATGDVNGGDGFNQQMGGLVGKQNGGKIIASYATGTGTGGTRGDFVGGLVGRSSGNITASYATGEGHGGAGGDKVGGLVGWQNSASEITASYATGATNSGGNDLYDAAGILVGKAKPNKIINSYGFGTATGKVTNNDGTPQQT